MQRIALLAVLGAFLEAPAQGWRLRRGQQSMTMARRHEAAAAPLPGGVPGAIDGSLPFYIHPSCTPSLLQSDMGRSRLGTHKDHGYDLLRLLNHPARRVWNATAAGGPGPGYAGSGAGGGFLVFVCADSKTRQAQMIASPEELPILGPGSAYVFNVQGLNVDRCSQDMHTSTCQAWHSAWSSGRGDVLYFSMDRTEMRLCDNTGLSELPGVTMAPPPCNLNNVRTCNEEKSRHAANPTARDRRYLVTFAGKNHEGYGGSSMARPWLYRSYHESYPGNGSDVLVSNYLPTMDAYMDMLRRSKFAFVPRGDGRWNFRIQEVLETGAVPVFLSDGYEPPYAPLFDTSTWSVTFAEEQARDLPGLARALVDRYSDDDVDRMSRHGAEIYHRCFAGPDARIGCLLESLSMLVERSRRGGKTGGFSTESVAKRMSTPLCPKKIWKNDDSGRVLYENNTFETFRVRY